jgi:type IV secretion system protein VirB10
MTVDPAVSGAEGPAYVDMRPLVGRETGNRPLWIAMAVIIGAGLLLFAILEARRSSLTAPAVRPRAADLAGAQSTQPPLLYVPPEMPLSEPQPLTMPLPTAAPPVGPELRPPVPPRIVQPPIQMQPQSLPAPQPILAPPPISNTPAIVFDTTVERDAGGASGGGGSASVGRSTATATRARAARLVNRATVVPQGTLIAAVLETALDSTQPGQARALVSRDVANLHGDRILIPRGSRLFGEYSGALEAGQKRAQVQWTRLVRPDGVTIAIDSPAADRLGRAGIKGQVNTHFLERLGGALLQSSIDIGAGIATRSVGDSSVVVALPGTVQGATSQLVGPVPKPTLKIRQGTRISVFVIRDLDFTAVESRR